jgi:hypothetical protein
LKFHLRHSIGNAQVLVHCWGGLGSQLHAWHLLELLKLRFPSRNFGLVFHTAGVTKRFPEIEDFLPSNETRRVDDYDAKAPQGKGLRSHNSAPAKIVKSFAKQFFAWIGVENNQESLNKLVRIYPWTRMIRGHYSRIPINDAALSQISSKIFDAFENQPGGNFRKLVVHLRLGDLRDLADKSPIGEESLRHVLSVLSQRAPIEQTVIHSDSPELVSSFLGSSTHNSLVIRDLTVTPLSALTEMVGADYFVGTSSKLSLWASIFRLKLGKENTYVPRHMSLTLIELLGDESKKLNFYD